MAIILGHHSPSRGNHFFLRNPLSSSIYGCTCTTPNRSRFYPYRGKKYSKCSRGAKQGTDDGCSNPEILREAHQPHKPEGHLTLTCCTFPQPTQYAPAAPG